MPRRIPGNHWHDSRRAGCRIARRPLWLTEGLPDRPFLPTSGSIPAEVIASRSSVRQCVRDVSALAKRLSHTTVRHRR